VVSDKGYVMWDMWYVICDMWELVKSRASRVQCQESRGQDSKLTTQLLNHLTLLLCVYLRLDFNGVRGF